MSDVIRPVFLPMTLVMVLLDCNTVVSAKVNVDRHIFTHSVIDLNGRHDAVLAKIKSNVVLHIIIDGVKYEIHV